jgi:hypothetical protein
MPDIEFPPASALPVYRTLNLLQRGRKVLGTSLKRSESYLGAAVPIRRIARQVRQEIAALRDFGLAHVRFGSEAGEMIGTIRHPVSALPQKRTNRQNSR